MFRKKKHPLILQKVKPTTQPKEERVETSDTAENTDLVLVSEEQYALDLSTPQHEWYYGFKRSITKFETNLETIPYWRSYLSISAIFTTLVFIGFISYIIFKFYGQLPNEFPLIYSRVTMSWKLIGKEFLPLLPIILAVFLLVITKTNIQTYRFDRRLATMTNFIIILVNMLGILAFAQLFSLILIY